MKHNIMRATSIPLPTNYALTQVMEASDDYSTNSFMSGGAVYRDVIRLHILNLLSLLTYWTHASECNDFRPT